jgi:hypothetical protein
MIPTTDIAGLQLPVQVAKALLARQPRLRTLSEAAKQRSVFWRLLNFRAAIVEHPVPLAEELSFWAMESDQALEDFLFDKLLAALPPDGISVDLGKLPSGYLPLLEVLGFEQHRQFEGWTAATNIGATKLRSICACYVQLGLTDEAAALDRVGEQLSLCVEVCDETEGLLELAYSSVPNSTATLEARIPYLLGYVRSRPDCFGEPATGR